ncbi:MAG TPA: gliding motility protein GldN [Ferruginibacter sp.]|nr:gliding motility protein GldN [Ferruginibacter sp.]HRE62611.1 gliding motility protein GldN [Ferruginibacter sp.]
MKNRIIKCLLLVVLVGFISEGSFAQTRKKKATTRKSTKRTTSTRTKAKIQPTVATADTVAAVAVAPAPAIDTLPIKKVAKSLRRDAAVDDDAIRDRIPLAYEHLRADDAVYRHKVWREIDAREKINLPFRNPADQDNGNQRFISILLQAIQDSSVTVFGALDDRFTTPMTVSEVAAVIAGAEVDVPQYDENGNLTGTKKMRNEINLDSIYKFRIKEEVVFDKESSRLFWRILGIAPVKRVITPQGLDIGETELFWVYYPDMRVTFAKYDVYNGKNFGARMSWEELFESRMFYGRIIKSTIDNPYDQYIKNYKGLQENSILQLLEGENIKEKIFNYEQDLWSY